MRPRIASPDIPTAPAGVRIRARLLGMRVPEAWLGWAKQDVRAPTWPIWQGLAVTLWGAVGLLLALGAFRLGGESFGTGMVLFVVAVYGFVIALAVVVVPFLASWRLRGPVCRRIADDLRAERLHVTGR